MTLTVTLKIFPYSQLIFTLGYVTSFESSLLSTFQVLPHQYTNILPSGYKPNGLYSSLITLYALSFVRLVIILNTIKPNYFIIMHSHLFAYNYLKYIQA